MVWSKGEFEISWRGAPGEKMLVRGWKCGPWGIALRTVTESREQPSRTLTHVPTGLSIGEPSPRHTQLRHLKRYAAALDRLIPEIGQAQTEAEAIRACNGNPDAIKEARKEACQP